MKYETFVMAKDKAQFEQFRAMMDKANGQEYVFITSGRNIRGRTVMELVILDGAHLNRNYNMRFFEEIYPILASISGNSKTRDPNRLSPANVLGMFAQLYLMK